VLRMLGDGMKISKMGEGTKRGGGLGGVPHTVRHICAVLYGTIRYCPVLCLMYVRNLPYLLPTLCT